MSTVPVFVSAPKSFLKRQEAFHLDVERALVAHGLRPMTLGRSDYDMAAPLEAIRRLMLSSCGLLCLAFRRTYIENGTDRPGSDNGEPERQRGGGWLTSAYSQIEPAMAYQIGLPIILWREAGVIDDGVFDRGVVGLDMPVFDLSSPPDLQDDRWQHPLRAWVDLARAVHRKRGAPPQQW